MIKTAYRDGFNLIKENFWNFSLLWVLLNTLVVPFTIFLSMIDTHNMNVVTEIAIVCCTIPIFSFQFSLISFIRDRIKKIDTRIFQTILQGYKHLFFYATSLLIYLIPLVVLCFSLFFVFSSIKTESLFVYILNNCLVIFLGISLIMTFAMVLLLTFFTVLKTGILKSIRLSLSMMRKHYGKVSLMIVNMLFFILIAFANELLINKLEVHPILSIAIQIPVSMILYAISIYFISVNMNFCLSFYDKHPSIKQQVAIA